MAQGRPCAAQGAPRPTGPRTQAPVSLHGTHSSSIEEPVGTSCWSHFPTCVYGTHTLASATPSSVGELRSCVAARDVRQPSLMQNQVAIYEKTCGGLSSNGLITAVSDEEEKQRPSEDQADPFSWEQRC